MLPSDLLIHRFVGEEIIPKRLPLDKRHLQMANEVTKVFAECVHLKKADLDERLEVLEGEETDYRIKRGLAHILHNSFAEFGMKSPLEPEILRKLVFQEAAKANPSREDRQKTLERIAQRLSLDSGKEILAEAIEEGLYADLEENQRLLSFEAPNPEDLLHRYNLAQVQGVLYRASHIMITAYRNDPGEYKQLFRYLKLFGLMSYIEGDADHGFSISIDGPASLFKSSTRYGTDLAKFLPSLLHVSKWQMEAQLAPRKMFDGRIKQARFALDADCGLVSHYKKGKVYDSAVEESFAKRWPELKSDWRLEREVELVPLPGSVMIPDFRLVHPAHQPQLLEIVGYWRPEYLRKKFAQVRKAERSDLILAISERLNLGEAGVKLDDVPAKVIWFKGKVQPKDVLNVLAA
ncbi:MAG: DUF790 family protein [Deinococcales bacterium]